MFFQTLEGYIYLKEYQVYPVPKRGSVFDFGISPATIPRMMAIESKVAIPIFS
jgi:hypothetical protein